MVKEEGSEEEEEEKKEVRRIKYEVIYGRRRKRRNIRCFLKLEFFLWMLKEMEMINIWRRKRNKTS